MRPRAVRSRVLVPHFRAEADWDHFSFLFGAQLGNALCRPLPSLFIFCFRVLLFLELVWVALIRPHPRRLPSTSLTTPLPLAFSGLLQVS